MRRAERDVLAVDRPLWERAFRRILLPGVERKTNIALVRNEELLDLHRKPELRSMPMRVRVLKLETHRKVIAADALLVQNFDVVELALLHIQRNGALLIILQSHAPPRLILSPLPRIGPHPAVPDHGRV